MKEPENIIHRNFSLYPHQLDFLQDINKDNTSQALRTLIDSIINGQEQTQRKKILDNSIMWACFGSIFLFISYLLEPTLQLISILIGTFLFAYGIIGGILLALPSTKQRRNNHQ